MSVYGAYDPKTTLLLLISAYRSHIFLTEKQLLWNKSTMQESNGLCWQYLMFVDYLRL